MNRICKRILLFCGTGGILFGGWKAIPLMQSVQIGTAALPASAMPADAAAVLLPEASEAAESGYYDVPETKAPAQTAVTNVINWESDASKAMWYAKPYDCPVSDSGGAIIEKQYSGFSGDLFFSLEKAGMVRNSTFWSNTDLLRESKIKPELPLKADGTPMVLIYHTHTTESYVSEASGGYDASFNFRTTQPDSNMVAVGDAIAEQLSAAGIGVVHAQELHDYPVWSGSYNNSRRTIEAVLAEYPSICIALDIHRDAISAGSTVYAPVCTINGKKSAQIMIISGCDDGTMGMPDYIQNFHFASALQQTAEGLFPGLTRPILFDYRKYNQDLTHGSLLIEVGSQGNTLDEACYAGELVGQALSETILQLIAENPAEGE